MAQAEVAHIFLFKENAFMDRGKNDRFVLTGGPGSGKTTLIDGLARAGCSAMPESGRGVIRQQEATGGHALPWADRLSFAELMLSWDVRSYFEAANLPGPVFFDRGVPDVLGYLELCGVPAPAHMREAAALFRYEGDVFILPPWREIFVNDKERRQSFEEAQRTYETMAGIYQRFGYRLVEVPRAPVEERLRFIHSGLREPPAP
jgi:predicted ATPase